MSVIARSWLSFAAIGAGTIHLALVISSPLVIGIFMALLGLAEIAWGALILIKDRLVLARVAQAGVVTPLILWALLTVAATLLNAPEITAALRFTPMGIATLFELFIAVVLSAHLRHRANQDRVARTTQPVGAVKYLSAVLVAGVLVGGLTTPALAATQAGTVATEHGSTMGGMMNMSGMGH